jgi:hypothetical protein
LIVPLLHVRLAHRPLILAGLLAATLPLSMAPAWGLAATPALAEVQQVYKTNGANEALRRVGVLIAQHPQDATLRFQQGVMLAEQHRTAEAITVFQRLTKDQPDMPEAFNNLAVLYAEQGQIDKASATLEQAMRTRPNYGTAFDNLRSTYNRMAGRAYAKALQIEETPQPPKLALIQELYEPPAPPPLAVAAAPAASKAVPAHAAASAAPPPIVVAAAPPPPVVPPAPAPAPRPAASQAAAPAPVQASAPAVKASAPPATTAATAASKPSTAPPPPAKPAASAPVAVAKASAPAKPPAPAARPVDDAQQVRNAINDWARAWARKDMNGYFAAYVPGFKGTDASNAAWQSARKARILGKKRIVVEISGISVSIDKGVARATFRQDYAADALRFSDQKTLQLVPHNGKWLIDKEVAGS